MNFCYNLIYCFLSLSLREFMHLLSSQGVMKTVVFILLFIPFTLSAQRYVSGKITNAENKAPVAGASVFLSNTTIGAFTDVEGHYQLKIPEEGSYQLTISYVGYQSVFRDIEPGNISVEFNSALHIREKELQEVTVAAKIKFRRKDISLFWKTILGENPSPKTIQVLNPEAVYYYYNPETRILKVTCHEPLQFVNYETGYQIQYVLNYFTYDYNKDISDWSNQIFFTELASENLKQKSNWEKKRQEVYNISLVKFIKSLYNNSLYNDGFVLGTIRQNPNLNNVYQISLLNPDSILSIKSADNSKTLNFSKEKIMLICYGSPITAKDLYAIQDMQGKEFKYSALFMNLLYGDSIRIFPDGTYTNKLLMAPVNSSNTLLGLNTKLPIEYHPEELALPAKKNENAFDSDSIAQHFNTQLRVFPQEKIHLHTDRDYYVPGEKIWFKAYLADAATLLPVANSRYVYVELIGSNDSLVSRVMIHPENGMFYGHLFLSEIIPEGNYTLRAYTGYMENLGDNYFFKKNIRIGNLGKKQSTQAEQEKGIANQARNDNKYYKRTQAVSDDFDVSFFPEGGNLVEGVFCKVAFKALNRNGYSETITGEITDEADSIITSVQTFHAGMGVFNYFPEPEKRYFLKCRNGNSLEKRFELPKPDPCACSLAVSQHNRMITVEVRKSAGSLDAPLYLLGHCRGMIFHFSALQWITGDPKSSLGLNDIKFSEKNLPAGVLQFILFDEQMNPLSERLVFNKNYDCAKVEFRTDSETYKTREKVTAALSLTDSDGNPQIGNLSVAITDDKDIAVDSTTTISSTLLLSSELRGYIENPAYYLQDNPESAIALDYLMLTHGWRRYNIPEVVKGNYETPQFPFQTSQEISGMAIGGFRSKPLTDSEVLIMSKDGDFGTTTTDTTGAFKYKNIEYPDSTSFFVQALGKKGSGRIELVVDSPRFPPLIHAPQTPFIENFVKKEDSNTFITKAEQRSKYDENMRVIQLREVEVTAKRIEKREEPRLEYWENIGSDVTVRREEFEKWYPHLVSDILKRIAGVQIFSNGAISIRHSLGLPLVLIDGIGVAWTGYGDRLRIISPYESPLERVSVDDVESIDVFKGASVAIFGTGGADGVISITTRRGIDVIREADSIRAGKPHNYAIYNPLGYQKPAAFYSPKYETSEAKQSTVPDYRTTIFWKPDLVVSDTGEASFDFYTSDFPTTYSIVIEGLTNDGKIVRQVEKIRVE